MEVELKGQNKSYVHAKWQPQQCLRNKTLSMVKQKLAFEELVPEY